jgi:excisionase family DNA binding protein
MSETRRSYSPKQLADELGVSVQTIQRWADAGHLKAWKTLGGHRKIDGAPLRSCPAGVVQNRVPVS